MELRQEPTPEFTDFMRQATVELYSVIMEFIKEKIDKLPDEPQIVHTAISSIVSAAIAFFIAYSYSEFDKEKIMNGSVMFCDSIMRNLEALIDRPDFNFMMGKEE